MVDAKPKPKVILKSQNHSTLFSVSIVQILISRGTFNPNSTFSLKHLWNLPFDFETCSLDV
jgi:hypothetical protein